MYGGGGSSCCYDVILDSLYLLYCNKLQLTVTHCNTLQNTAKHTYVCTHQASCCNAPKLTLQLQHTETHCNTLQHIATPCNTHIRVHSPGELVQRAEAIHATIPSQFPRCIRRVIIRDSRTVIRDYTT